MIEQIKTWAIVLLSIAIVTMAFVSIALLPGCMTSPTREDYTLDECWMFADCLYRIKSGPDKSACQAIGEACRDALKESRALRRLEYCKTHLPAGMSENECRLWLNQK